MAGNSSTKKKRRSQYKQYRNETRVRNQEIFDEAISKERTSPEEGLYSLLREGVRNYIVFNILPVDDPKRFEVTEEFAKTIMAKAPKLWANRDRSLWGIFFAVLKYGTLRPLSEWKPKGKGANSLYRSLASHLLVEYPVPAFLYGLLKTATTNNNVTWRADLFVHLARGGSMYKAVKSGQFPIPLTKRMCHLFMQAPASSGVIESARRAQITVFGGDRRLIQTFLATRWGTDHFAFEPFVATVFQWFCNHSMIDPAQVGPLFDYINHCRGEDVRFSMKGRSPLALMRGMEEWHGELHKSRKLNGLPFDPSGFSNGEWEGKKRLPNGNSVNSIWTCREILGSKELAMEGRTLKHCVYSYGRSIQSGQMSIWSLRQDDKRRVTVSVWNKNKTVGEARGKLNKMPSSKEKVFIQRWAALNNLIIRGF